MKKKITETLPVLDVEQILIPEHALRVLMKTNTFENFINTMLENVGIILRCDDARFVWLSDNGCTIMFEEIIDKKFKKLE